VSVFLATATTMEVTFQDAVSSDIGLLSFFIGVYTHSGFYISSLGYNFQSEALGCFPHSFGNRSFFVLIVLYKLRNVTNPQGRVHMKMILCRDTLKMDLLVQKWQYSVVDLIPLIPVFTFNILAVIFFLFFVGQLSFSFFSKCTSIIA